MSNKLRALGLALGAVLIGAPVASYAQSDALDRSVLPIPEPPVPVYTELDARNAKPPGRFEVKAPEGAPNVLIVLLDDMGFGQSSAFGGPINMPTVTRSPTRVFVTMSSIQRRCARRHGRPCSPAVTTTSTTWGRSPKPPPLSRATPACVRTA